MTTEDLVEKFAVRLADGTRVSYAHGYEGHTAIAAVVKFARANPGTIVTLIAAIHPKAESDAEIAVSLAIRILKRARNVDALIFRPL